MPKRLTIGLTGGIASGKSTVAERFLELGTPVIDADQVARDVVAPGQPGLLLVLERFGIGMRNPSGTLNRQALRDRIFKDPSARRDLEAALHPLINAEMRARAEHIEGPYIVLAIPLLVEGGSRDNIDRILCVDVDGALQLTRLMARDGGSEDQALAMLAAQASRAERLAVADDVLVNDGTVSDLRQQVDTLHARYLKQSLSL